MKVLRASLASSSSASYLVSGSRISADARVITPQREEPEPFLEPDWNSLLDPGVAHLGEEDLVRKVNELQRGLLLARDCLRAREAVIESAHATNIILELTCQRQRATLHRKEEAKLEKRDKRTLSGDGKAHVVTDDDFIQVLEEIEEKAKEEEEGKERRKEARAKAKESKIAEKEAWERALEEWKSEKEVWEEECEQLKEDGCLKKDLPKAPKRPRKADVIAALDEGSSEDSDPGSDEDEEAEDDGEGGGEYGSDGDGSDGGDGDGSEGE